MARPHCAAAVCCPGGAAAEALASDPEAEAGEGEPSPDPLVALVCGAGMLRRLVQLLCASDPETRLGACMALAKLCVGTWLPVGLCAAGGRVLVLV